jgi:hypothetical protein
LKPAREYELIVEQHLLAGLKPAPTVLSTRGGYLSIADGNAE